MKGKKFVISILGLLLSAGVHAQTGNADTSINGATIEIIQSYKPEVTQPPRAELVPSLPPIDTAAPRLRYTVPAQSLSYVYSSLPLRPLALSLDTSVEKNLNYVKLGGGSLSTIYLDAGISTLKSDNLETAFQVHHLSQAGNNISDQKVSLTGVSANGAYHKNGNIINAGLDVNHNQYHYYGYDHSLFNYNISTVKQAFTSVGLNIGLQKEDESISKLNYRPSLHVAYLGDKFNATETTIGAKLPVTYTVDDNLSLYAAINATFTGLNNATGVAQNNHIIQFAPGIIFNTESFSLKAGISPTVGTNKTYILPDLLLNFSLPETQFMFQAGYKGDLRQNSYLQLSTLNPFMYNTYNVSQTNTSEIFGGIKSNLGNNISFSGKLSWWQFNNLPVFLNDTTTDSKQFIVLYDNKVNAIGLQASINYQVAEIFAVGIHAQWMNFYNKSLNQIWHRPGIDLKGDISIQPSEKLTITSYISFIDELYALEKGNNTKKLSTILDIGAGAEYNLLKQLNLFVQANNILNSKYQRWYGYDAFGMNIFGGIRLKF